MAEVIDYTKKDLDYNAIFEAEKKRQSKDPLENIKVKLKCRNCKKEYEKWLFDPTLKTLTCSYKCEVTIKQKDFYDKNSDKLAHECYICGKTFVDDSIIVGKSREEAQVNRECLVCSDKCRRIFENMFEKEDKNK